MDGIFGLIYNIIIIAVFIFSSQLKNKNNHAYHILALVLITLGAFLIGSRDISVGKDTLDYYYMFSDIESNRFDIGLHGLFILSEPIFYLLIKVSTSIGTFNDVLIIISFLTLTASYSFCKKYSDILGFANPLAILCCYLISFYILGQQINIIRAGLGAPMLLNYYFAVYKNDKKNALFWGILALGIHFSSIIGLVLALIPKLIKLENITYIIIFIIILLLSSINFGILNIPIFNNIDLGSKSSYLSGGSSNYVVGFRFGFALFNTFFLFYFYYALKNHNIISRYFFQLYVIFSCIFFLCFQIPFSDRIGALSWNLIPFITIQCMYILNKKSIKTLYLSFLTLFIVKIGISIL